MKATTDLNLPPYPFRITEQGGQTKLFDPLRKKWLVLTPEEWVRQHMVQLLIHGYNYPKGLIHLEKQHKDNEWARRTDIVSHDRNAAAYLLIECKAPEIPINDQVLLQASNYNRVLQAPYLAITNGLQTFAWQLIQDKYQALKDLPSSP